MLSGQVHLKRRPASVQWFCYHVYYARIVFFSQLFLSFVGNLNQRFECYCFIRVHTQTDLVLWGLATKKRARWRRGHWMSYTYTGHGVDRHSMTPFLLRILLLAGWALWAGGKSWSKRSTGTFGPPNWICISLGPLQTNNGNLVEHPACSQARGPLQTPYHRPPRPPMSVVPNLWPNISSSAFAY